jgi:hypothetical protein
VRISALLDGAADLLDAERPFTFSAIFQVHIFLITYLDPYTYGVPRVSRERTRFGVDRVLRPLHVRCSACL